MTAQEKHDAYEKAQEKRNEAHKKALRHLN